MNNRGNIMLGFLFFIMGLAVVVMFTPVINTFINMEMQSDNLNCYGYIHNGNASNPLSWDSTLNGGDSGSPVACLALKLYLPYILLVILIAGVSGILSNRDPFNMNPQEAYAGGGQY